MTMKEWNSRLERMELKKNGIVIEDETKNAHKREWLWKNDIVV